LPTWAGWGTIGDMTPRRGKHLVVLVALGAGLVLGGAAYVFRGRIAEEYWLWRLEKGSDADKRLAAENLGRLHSARAVPQIFDTRSHSVLTMFTATYNRQVKKCY
jgi:hypothetical protein